MSGPAVGTALLLDTCAVIWLATKAPISQEAQERIVQAAQAGDVLVSPISAWEIGLLSRPRAGRTHQFLPDPETWFATFIAGPGVRAAPFTAQIAIAASMLPEPLHGDPADRLLIATARRLNVPLVTRDVKILAFAGLGHVAAIAC